MLKPGQQFDGFEVVSQIGAGGMGTVIRARQISLERDVAIKVMQAGAAAASEDGKLFIKRFKREVEIQSRLDHPNLVKVFDSGVLDGNLYVVLELVDGMTLAEAIDSSGPFDNSLSLFLAEGLLEGLVYLHSRSIVHRDLKPGNAMITHQGSVKLLDFGLARAEHHTAITAPGSLIGTLAYLAPEVLDGGNWKLESDIYALGIILHQMFTGKPPYKGTDMNSWCLLILNFEPPPMHLAHPGVPVEISQLVGRMLSKEEKQRPSAEECLEVVHEALANLRQLGANLERPTSQWIRKVKRATSAMKASPKSAASMSEAVTAPRTNIEVVSGSLGSRSLSSGSLGADSSSLISLTMLRLRSMMGTGRRGWAGVTVVTLFILGGMLPFLFWPSDVPPLYAMSVKYVELRSVLRENPALEGDAFVAVQEKSRRLASRKDPQVLANLAYLAEHPAGGVPDPGRSLTLWEEASRSGFSDALLKLGWVHLQGEGVPKDPLRGIAALEAAARGGSALACTLLGDVYRRGIGVEKDEVRTLQWLREGEKRGQALAIRHLGAIHRDGTCGVTMDKAKGRELLHRAAELGEEFAMYDLGLLYTSGDGVPPDVPEGLRWLRKSVDAGCPFAMVTLGARHIRGDGVEKDVKRGIAFYERAANLDHAFAQGRLGGHYWEGFPPDLPRDMQKGLHWLERAANGDSGFANWMLARIYLEGKDRPVDLTLATRYLQRAAEIGVPEAMNLLAAHYQQGKGVPTEFTKAVHWYEKAADAGFILARLNLARLLEEGIGAQADPVRARDLYRKAATEGLIDAQFHAGRVLVRGIGGPVDRAAGLEWLRRAAGAKHGMAMKLLGELGQN